LTFYQQLGMLLRSNRLKANKSQESLADELGLSRVTIVNIEQGRQKIHIHDLVKASEFLGVPLMEFIPNEKGKIMTEADIFSKITSKFPEQSKAVKLEDFVRSTLLKH